MDRVICSVAVPVNRAVDGVSVFLSLLFYISFYNFCIICYNFILAALLGRFGLNRDLLMSQSGDRERILRTLLLEAVIARGTVT